MTFLVSTGQYLKAPHASSSRIVKNISENNGRFCDSRIVFWNGSSWCVANTLFKTPINGTFQFYTLNICYVSNFKIPLWFLVRKTISQIMKLVCCLVTTPQCRLHLYWYILQAHHANHRRPVRMLIFWSTGLLSVVCVLWIERRRLTSPRKPCAWKSLLKTYLHWVRSGEIRFPTFSDLRDISFISVDHPGRHSSPEAPNASFSSNYRLPFLFYPLRRPLLIWSLAQSVKNVAVETTWCLPRPLLGCANYQHQTRERLENEPEAPEENVEVFLLEIMYNEETLEILSETWSET